MYPHNINNTPSHPPYSKLCINPHPDQVVNCTPYGNESSAFSQFIRHRATARGVQWPWPSVAASVWWWRLHLGILLVVGVLLVFGGFLVVGDQLGVGS